MKRRLAVLALQFTATAALAQISTPPPAAPAGGGPSSATQVSPVPPALPAPTAPAAPVDLARASYTLDALRVEGATTALTPEQLAEIVRAVNAELPAALARRYPQAHVVTAPDARAVRLTPVVVVPAMLGLFSSLEVRFELSVPGEPAPRVVSQRIAVSTLWNAQQDAHKLALDSMFGSLP